MAQSVDTTVIGSVGIAGIFPVGVLWLAQAVGDAASSIGDFKPWTDVAAAAVIFSVFVWMMTKYIPAKDEAAQKAQKERDELFTKALAMRDETSRLNAQSWHNALETLVKGQQEVLISMKDVCQSLDSLTAQNREICRRMEDLDRKREIEDAASAARKA